MGQYHLKIPQYNVKRFDKDDQLAFLCENKPADKTTEILSLWTIRAEEVDDGSAIEWNTDIWFHRCSRIKQRCSVTSNSEDRIIHRNNVLSENFQSRIDLEICV
jgi:hypothetical protein